MSCVLACRLFACELRGSVVFVCCLWGGVVRYVSGMFLLGMVVGVALLERGCSAVPRPS